MKYVKVYGVPRSGTNFLRAVLELNFDCRVVANIGGSKHEFIKDYSTNFEQVKTDLDDSDIESIENGLRKGEIPKVLVVKNPYAWVVSIANYRGVELDDRKIRHYMDYYVEHNNHWAERCELIVGYDDLLQLPEKFLSDFENLGFERTRSEYIRPEKRLRPGVDIQLKDNYYEKKFNEEYYRDKLYLKEFSKENLDIIDQYKINYIK